MKNWLTPLWLVVAMFALGACTSTSTIIATGLKIEVTRVERATDGTIQVSWRVRNPNIVSYLVDRSIHRVKLDGLVLGTITDTVRLGVPPQSPADRTSTITPNGGMSAEQFSQLAAKGSASYEVESTIYLLIYDDEITKSSLSASGTVPVSAK
jgi:hypothetical protein